MKRCQICRTDTVAELLDLGMQPICNRFLENPGEEEYKHRMVMGQCDSCGLVQLLDPVPAEELLPRYEWITYNEPEGHLDTLADIIEELPSITKESKIFGISFKDDTTLARMNKKGFGNTMRLDLEEDLGITENRAGIETIQHKFTPELANKLAEKHGKPDIFIVRHILEHTQDMQNFMRAIKEFVNPGGYVIFEVPDCTRLLEVHDYTMLWEEHIAYFTLNTFRDCLSAGGFSLVQLECFPYLFENSLVGITCLDKANIEPPLQEVIETEKSIATDYAEDFENKKNSLKKQLQEFKKNKGDIALFGAGHNSCTFINLFELKDYINFVVDDDPNKNDLFMPGSGLQIQSYDSLLKENIKLCLLSLSHTSEDEVISNNQSFLEGGGIFSSINPASKHALKFEDLK